VRILLTGDKGYIGAVMVPLLLLEGHTLTGLDSDWFEQSAFSELPGKMVSRKKDLRGLEPSDLEGFDARLAEMGQMSAFEHLGFWQPMDTLREKNQLEEL
jgi:nucleoside-diphosphate-sugar epimerase